MKGTTREHDRTRPPVGTRHRRCYLVGRSRTGGISIHPRICRLRHSGRAADHATARGAIRIPCPCARDLSRTTRPPGRFTAGQIRQPLDRCLAGEPGPIARQHESRSNGSATPAAAAWAHSSSSRRSRMRRRTPTDSRSTPWSISPTASSMNASAWRASSPAKTINVPSRTSCASAPRPVAPGRKPCWHGIAETGEFRSGQAPAGKGFSHWIMKFDGVHGNRDKELADPQGFGRIEYAYSLMAQRCRHHHGGMPPARRGWTRPFHDQALRSHRWW